MAWTAQRSPPDADRDGIGEAAGEIIALGEGVTD